MKILNSKPIYDIFSSKEKSNISEKKVQKPRERIIIDHREKNSTVPAELLKLDLEIEMKELKIGDYIVKDIIIERKTISDFLNSMMNNHLINQIEELKQFENKFLIIEGFDEKQLYYENESNGFINPINPNAIRGFLLSILLKHKIPIVYTKNSSDTAKFLSVLSKKREKETPLNGKKKTLDRKEQMQFIVESFPGIGPKTSKKLLEKFGSIQNIILAPTEELEKIIGKNAYTIRQIIERKY